MTPLKNHLALLSSGLFWNVQEDAINPEGHAQYIIERVASRGTLKDWEIIKKMYSQDKIKSVSVNIRSMDKKTLSFLSFYFKVPKNEFRCYKSKH